MPYVPPALRSTTVPSGSSGFGGYQAPRASPTLVAPTVPFVHKDRNPRYMGVSGLGGGELQEAPFAKGCTFLDPDTKEVIGCYVWDADVSGYVSISPAQRELRCLEQLELRAARLGDRRRGPAMAEINRRRMLLGIVEGSGAEDTVRMTSHHRLAATAGARRPPASSAGTPAPLFHPDL
jgi:hypothetical protein